MSGSWDFGGATSPAAGDDSWGDSSAPVPPGPSHGQDGFGIPPAGQPVPAAGSGGGSAPLTWLIVGVVAAVLAIAAALVTSSFEVSLAAWAIGGPVAIGLLAMFTAADNESRANPWYAESPLAVWGRRALVLLALVAVGLNAWTIADHFARTVTF